MKIKLVSFEILCALLLVPTISFAENKVGYVITTGRIWSTVDAFVGLMKGLSKFLCKLFTKENPPRGIFASLTKVIAHSI